MKKFTLLFALMIFTKLSSAQVMDDAMFYDFNEESDPSWLLDWTIENTNNDSATWQPTSFMGIDESNCYSYVYDSIKSNTANDWLISPAVSLNADKKYTLSFSYKTYTDDTTKIPFYEAMDVFYGNESTSKSMTNLLINLDTIKNYNFKEASIEITATANKNYYFGFHAKSPIDKAFGYILVIDNIMLTASTPIQEITNTLSQINIFPNPSTGMINIQNAVDVEVKVLDLLGNVVASKKIETIDNSSLDLSYLTSGIYLVKIANENSVFTQKINLIK